MFAISTFATTNANAEEYPVRHDRKLEQMIVTAAAGRVGTIRGALEGEWRAPTALSYVATLSALDVALYARALQQRRDAYIAAAPLMPSHNDMAAVTIRSSRGVELLLAGASGG